MKILSSDSKNEKNAFANWTICLSEIRLQEGLKQITSKILHGVINWEQVNPLAIFDVLALVQNYHVTQVYTQVFPHNLAVMKQW